MPRTHAHPVSRVIGLLALLVIVVSGAASSAVRAAPLAGTDVTAAAVVHVLISEIMTGGTGASDEFVEIYNPGAAGLTLDGLELIYVTASGATITRKATWGPGAMVAPGAHVLVANAAGIFAGVADLTYANGLAATGGSLALRVIGSATAVDAVGWGTATSTWLETTPAPAPAASSSLERLPGGELGSGQDTDHNLVDFVVRPVPDPQNSGSPAVPGPTPTPGPTAHVTPSPTPAPTGSPAPTETPQVTETPTSTATPSPPPTATPSPTPAPLRVAEARAMPDSASVTVAGVAHTDSTFAEGGGYLADASGGIAVMVAGATFTRGTALIISGVVDDRYAQRTIRTDAAGLTELGPGVPPEALPVATGGVGESLEGQLVLVGGIVQGAPVALAAGLAFEIDDGSGPARVVVGPTTGIDTGQWLRGATVGLTGVVGQRDSSGTGDEGYRVQPRDAADIAFVLVPPTPTPEPTPAVTPAPTAILTPLPTPSQPPLVTIAEARAAPVGEELRIRGVVTLPTGLLDANSAVVADPTGGILIRAGSTVGPLSRGQFIELTGTRSTLSGMLSLRATASPLALGAQAEPMAVRRSTGAIEEADEATLVVIRGVVRDGPRRTTGGGYSFTLNDGSGAFRVFAAPASGISTRHVPPGAWVEIRGVVGQQTTGALPDAGYRLWPRDSDDVRIVARPGAGGGANAPSPSAPPPSASLDLPGNVAWLVMPDLGPGPGSPPTRPDTSPPASADDSPAAPPSPVPLAAGLGGLAGLAVLAWRHGTIRRLTHEIERVTVRTGDHAGERAGGDERAGGESYTPPP